MTSGPKTVFIIGVARSGTTWVSWLLAQHPGIVACQQSGLFHAIQGIADWWEASTHHGKQLVGLPGTGEEGSYARRSLNDVLDREKFQAACGAVARSVFAEIAALDDRIEVVVEQTPENLVVAELIHELLPDAYFLHVVRDPRSVLCSLRKAVSAWADPGGFPTSPVEFGRIWCEYIDRSRSLARSTDRYHEIRYERLLKDGGSELAEILDWLGMPHDREFVSSAVAACTIDKLRANTPAPAGFFRKGSADTWRDEISTSQLRIVEHIAGDHMTDLGYELTLPRSDRAPLRVRAWQSTAVVVRWLVSGRLGPVVRRLMRLLRRTARLIQGMAAGTGGITRPDVASSSGSARKGSVARAGEGSS